MLERDLRHRFAGIRKKLDSTVMHTTLGPKADSGSARGTILVPPLPTARQITVGQRMPNRIPSPSETLRDASVQQLDRRNRATSTTGSIWRNGCRRAGPPTRARSTSRRAFSSDVYGSRATKKRVSNFDLVSDTKIFLAFLFHRCLISRFPMHFTLRLKVIQDRESPMCFCRRQATGSGPSSSNSDHLPQIRPQRVGSERLRWRSSVALLILTMLSASFVHADAITSVSLSRPFFNPTLDQKIAISFSLDRAGALSVLVLDRDGYPVRWLARSKAVMKGPMSFVWDGRSDSGETMPNEAYSLKIELESGGSTDSYFPATRMEGASAVQMNYYDRPGGTLSYTLDKPSRVHVQAGTGVADSRKKTTSGPVLRTLVNREPRPAGMVAESWNGFDERGAIYVPSLNHFVIGIAATPLPENSMLVSGGRGGPFSSGLRCVPEPPCCLRLRRTTSITRD